ncbi:MAG: heme A synthase [Deltaproteobacteria bacterium]|nr:heme A synthase [Deltaproteobacteria bacterium]
MAEDAPNPADPHRAIRRWLWVVFFAIAVMVALGGITRLTGSGLSMVEWRPLMGTLPPLDHAEWLRVFARYQRSPQYAQVNSWMQLADFQRIFFWEYFHRLFGRLIGLLVFVPWLYFMARRRLKGRLAWRVFGALALGGAQGLMGWLMVKSGLVNEPAVSHFRLAAHLLLAFFVAQYILWLILDLAPARPESAPVDKGTRRGLGALLALVVVQLAFGAFMAGKRAGWLSASFPDMNGHYLPGPFFHSANVLHEALNGPMAIHYVHRFLGFVVALAVIGFALWARRRALPPRLRFALHAMLLTTLLQFTLGALTVVFHVPTWLAVAHQLGGFALLSVGVAALHAAVGVASVSAQAGRAASRG